MTSKPKTPKMPKPPKEITSGFAILDVTKGRNKLAHALRPTCTSRGQPIPVTITGTIVDIYGGDDGTSREFEIKVTKVELG